MNRFKPGSIKRNNCETVAMYSNGRSETVLNQEYAHSEDSTIEKLSSEILLQDLAFIKKNHNVIYRL